MIVDAYDRAAISVITDQKMKESLKKYIICVAGIRLVSLACLSASDSSDLSHDPNEVLTTMLKNLFCTANVQISLTQF